MPEQLREGEQPGRTGSPGDNHMLDSTFVHHLPAGAARQHPGTASDDRDRPQPPVPLGDRPMDRHPLGAHRQTVRGVLNVAA